MSADVGSVSQQRVLKLKLFHFFMYLARIYCFLLVCATQEVN